MAGGTTKKQSSSKGVRPKATTKQSNLSRTLAELKRGTLVVNLRDNYRLQNLGRGKYSVSSPSGATGKNFKPFTASIEGVKKFLQSNKNFN